MRVEMVNISDIKPYKRNPRKNENAVDKVAESIKQFGWQQPIVVDKDGVIIVGHTRYKAAKKLGFTEVPVLWATDLTEEQVRAYRLADNKTNELAEWDMTLLYKELASIIDINMADFGFAEALDELEEDLFFEDEPEVEFTEVLGEEHNYIVLFFDNDVDWLQAQSLFDIKTVKGFSTKRSGNGKITKMGVGRVINGAKVLERICRNENIG